MKLRKRLIVLMLCGIFALLPVATAKTGIITYGDILANFQTTLGGAMAMAFSPIGIIISGPLAKAIGYVPLFVGGIVLGTISITVIWLVSKVRQIDPIVEDLEEKEREQRRMEKELSSKQIDKKVDEIPTPVLAG